MGYRCLDLRVLGRAWMLTLQIDTRLEVSCFMPQPAGARLQSEAAGEQTSEPFAEHAPPQTCFRFERFRGCRVLRRPYQLQLLPPGCRLPLVCQSNGFSRQFPRKQLLHGLCCKGDVVHLFQVESTMASAGEESRAHAPICGKPQTRKNACGTCVP